ncbi:MAG: TraR/DksA family transcriptional regulator [Thermodesulfobacteriota bacterium]
MATEKSKKAKSTSNKTKKQTSAKKAAVSKTTKSKRQPGPDEYNLSFLEEMKAMLVQMRRELLKDVIRSVKEESDHLRFDVGDFYDHASEDRQRELALTLSNRERNKLIQIDDSLKRIEDGSYGFCEVTGEKIGEERLRAMPFTTLSIEAQEEMERGVF